MIRTIWRYESSAIGDLGSESLRSASVLFAEHESVFAGLPILGQPAPVFTAPKVSLRGRVLRAFPKAGEDPVLDLAAYHHAFVETPEDAAVLRERLLNTRGVARVELQPRPSRPVWWSTSGSGQATPAKIMCTLKSTTTPNFERLQGYLQPAPDGVDARHAWTIPGGRGARVKIVDIEGGWNLQHEDLLSNLGGKIHGQNDGHDHGTAVLGVFGGDLNGWGITGIASDAVAFGASLNDEIVVEPISQRRVYKWNAAAAIEAAVQRLAPGDVILLELQTAGPNGPFRENDQHGCIPVEYWDAEYAAIRYATSRGLHVVEAGANGSQDLDDGVYQGLFDRGRRDSGAVLVGAGAPATGRQPRATLDFSNHGSRMDVQGWGDGVVTAGGHTEDHYYDLHYDEDPARCYTQSFGGTSSASPIVAGVVACLTSAARAARRPLPGPAEMRQLLVATGTAQTGGGHIGPLPDLRRALGVLGLR